MDVAKSACHNDFSSALSNCIKNDVLGPMTSKPVLAKVFPN
jgi:hypothetical protein